MNVPAIRKALEQLDRSFMASQHHGAPHPVTAAVVRVGLRACESMDKGALTYDEAVQLRVIADILREAGVVVEG